MDQFDEEFKESVIENVKDLSETYRNSSKQPSSSEPKIKCEEEPEVVVQESITVSEEEALKRRDLRSKTIFTIDPATAKDLDDALSIEELADGTFEVGIHIADVSYYVEKDSPLDIEARTRGTTIYLTNRNIPMLPRKLCENLCSLVPNVDRLTFSVFLKLDEKGTVLSEPWFGRTIIRSCAQIAYETAQKFIQGESFGDDEIYVEKPHTIDDIRSSVLNLNKIARNLRDKRVQRGSLLLNNPKIYFDLDEETKMPTSVKQYISKESNNLVEEFMLMANKAVGNRILASYPDGTLLRAHRSPEKRKLKDMALWAKNVGLKVDASTAKALQNTLDFYKNDFIVLNCLRFWLTKPMCLAKYTSTESDLDPTRAYHHFGLGFDVYTHFTSPIRRYADLIVHRELQCALTNEPIPHPPSEIKSIVDNCNTRKVHADQAQDNCDKLFLSHYIRKQPDEVVRCEAIINHVFKSGAEVIVPRFALDSRILFDGFRVVEKKKTSVILEREKTQFELHVFDVVLVDIGVTKKTQIVPEFKCKLVQESALALKDRIRDPKQRVQEGKELEEKYFPKVRDESHSSQRDPLLVV